MDGGAAVASYLYNCGSAVSVSHWGQPEVQSFRVSHRGHSDVHVRLCPSGQVFPGLGRPVCSLMHSAAFILSAFLAYRHLDPLLFIAGTLEPGRRPLGIAIDSAV